MLVEIKEAETEEDEAEEVETDEVEEQEQDTTKTIPPVSFHWDSLLRPLF